MEKKKPHYALDAIQKVVAARRANAFTATALLGAAQLGLSPDEAVEILLGMKSGHDLARRLSRRAQIRACGVYQSDAARKRERRDPVQGEMK